MNYIEHENTLINLDKVELIKLGNKTILIAFSKESYFTFDYETNEEAQKHYESIYDAIDTLMRQE